MRSLLTYAMNRLRSSWQARREKRVSRSRRLFFCEQLEDRCLLANLGLGINLWMYDANDPTDEFKGTAIDPTQPGNFNVSTGTKFLIQIVVDDTPTATDSNQVSAGVISLPLNINWNGTGATVVQYTGPVPATSFPVIVPPQNTALTPTQILTNALVTTNFPQLRGYGSFASYIHKLIPKPRLASKQRMGLPIRRIKATIASLVCSNFKPIPRAPSILQRTWLAPCRSPTAIGWTTIPV